MTESNDDEIDLIFRRAKQDLRTHLRCRLNAQAVDNDWQKDALEQRKRADHAHALLKEARAILGCEPDCTLADRARAAVVEIRRLEADNAVLAVALSNGVRLAKRLAHELSYDRMLDADGVRQIMETLDGHLSTDSPGKQLLAELERTEADLVEARALAQQLDGELDRHRQEVVRLQAAIANLVQEREQAKMAAAHFYRCPDCRPGFPCPEGWGYVAALGLTDRARVGGEEEK